MVCDPEKKSTFKSHFNIYISFFSVEGINIRTSVKFIDVNEFRKKNLASLAAGPQQKERTEEEIAETNRISKEPLKGYEKNRPKFRCNFVEENKFTASASMTRSGSPWQERQHSAT